MTLNLRNAKFDNLLNFTPAFLLMLLEYVDRSARRKTDKIGGEEEPFATFVRLVHP